jgi:hypothetical protein
MFSLILETAFGEFKKLVWILILDWFLGAVKALRDPITGEMLCSLIDTHLKQNIQRELTN